MNLKEASRFAFAEKTQAEFRFHLTESSREITLRGSTSDVTCFEKVLLSREYESPFPINPKVIVDGGANIGLATIYYSQEYPNAKIIAIEPERSNYEMLQKNCAGLPNVTLINGALWSEEAKLAIKDQKSENWAFSVTASYSESSESIDAITIPGILDKFGLDRIDILKLDIEGAEYELFRSGADGWLTSVGQIVIELHDRYRSGCAQAFYAAIGRTLFAQEMRGENTFIRLIDETAQ